MPLNGASVCLKGKYSIVQYSGGLYLPVSRIVTLDMHGDELEQLWPGVTGQIMFGNCRYQLGYCSSRTFPGEQNINQKR